MQFWILNVRKIVFLGAGLVASAVYLANAGNILEAASDFGHGAMILLYVTLLISPWYFCFPSFPYKVIVVKARKALGVSAFFFALSHGLINFTVLIGGVNGLLSLNTSLATSILFGQIALVILSVMAITSLNSLIARLGKYWKMIHRFVYVAAVLIFLHVVTVTVHELNEKIIAFLSLGFLLILEAIRFRSYLRLKYKRELGIWVGLGLLVMILGMFWMLFGR